MTGFVLVPEKEFREIQNSLARVERALGIVVQQGETLVSEQDEVNADVATIEQVVTDEQSAVQNIEAELQAAEAANPSVDLSGLDAAVGDLEGADKAVDALEAPAPAADAVPAEAVPADAAAQ